MIYQEHMNEKWAENMQKKEDLKYSTNDISLGQSQMIGKSVLDVIEEKSSEHLSSKRMSEKSNPGQNPID